MALVMVHLKPDVFLHEDNYDLQDHVCYPPGLAMAMNTAAARRDGVQTRFRCETMEDKTSWQCFKTFKRLNKKY